MSAQHTLGPLTHEGQGDITGIENDPANGCVGKVDVACVYLRTVPGRHEANARRLVACWNACDGLPTDLLEDDSIMKIEGRIRRERDELLEALRKATDALAGGLWDYGPGQDEHDQCDQVVDECRAAIAKATGGAA